jgi:rhodanese-related sulfurtransferase
MEQIDVHELKRRLDAEETFRLVDVRETEEWELCRLPRAELIPLSVFAQRAPELLPRDGVPIILYCHHGVRSLHAAQFLQQHGYTRLINLIGGIHAWSKGIDPRVPTY